MGLRRLCFEIFGAWRLFRYEHGLCNIEQTEAEEDDEDDEYDVCRAFPVAGSAGPVLQAIEAVLAGEVVVPITARDDGATRGRLKSHNNNKKLKGAKRPVPLRPGPGGTRRRVRDRSFIGLYTTPLASGTSLMV